MSLSTASITSSDNSPVASNASVVNYSISDPLIATMRGSINGHSITRIIVGALTWPTFLMHAVVRSKTIVNFRLNFLLWGSLQGIIANLAHEKLEQRSSYFKEHKNISLITAGITSSAIVMLVGSSVEAYRGNLSSLSSSEKIQCLTALIIALAPVGIAGAWMENVYNK